MCDILLAVHRGLHLSELNPHHLQEANDETQIHKMYKKERPPVEKYLAAINIMHSEVQQAHIYDINIIFIDDAMFASTRNAMPLSG